MCEREREILQRPSLALSPLSLSLWHRAWPARCTCCFLARPALTPADNRAQGFEKVQEAKKWREFALQLGVPKTCTSATAQLRFGAPAPLPELSPHALLPLHLAPSCLPSFLLLPSLLHPLSSCRCPFFQHHAAMMKRLLPLHAGPIISSTCTRMSAGDCTASSSQSKS